MDKTTPKFSHGSGYPSGCIRTMIVFCSHACLIKWYSLEQVGKSQPISIQIKIEQVSKKTMHQCVSNQELPSWKLSFSVFLDVPCIQTIQDLNSFWKPIHQSKSPNLCFSAVTNGQIQGFSPKMEGNGWEKKHVTRFHRYQMVFKRQKRLDDNLETKRSNLNW